MAVPEERIEIGTPKGAVTGVWAQPPRARAVLAVAPGAGSDLDHPFLSGFTRALNRAGIATLRFNFLYKERGRRSPDPERTLREVWLSAFDAAQARARPLPVFAGGKSMGGRIASMCAADGMPAAGLVFLGYPLHPPRDPEAVRDGHLYRSGVPMLFLQGTRDPFAREEKLAPVVARLGARATLQALEGGDHSFRVKGERRDDREIGASLAPFALAFIEARL